MGNNEVKWKQKEFERLYEVISGSRDGKHPEYLPGTFEMENFRNGYGENERVVRIGLNSEKIKMIN